ncbi:MAG: hypothetical protein O2856_06155 [Planctomycetota bacterium]|nr:hypothetical protein [Planctomycetota bacterium]
MQEWARFHLRTEFAFRVWAPFANKVFLVNGLWRVDLRARGVTNSVGNGIIVSQEFGWQIN